MKLPRLQAGNADQLLDLLSQRQFVYPHQPVGQALVDIAGRMGYCEMIADRALAWLELDREAAIGRLRRTELAQLARCLHRLWRQTGTERRTSVSDTTPHVASAS